MGIWGRGNTQRSDPQETKCDSEKAMGGANCRSAPGMPQYDFHLLLASLNIVDTPVGHSPPFGPPVYFTLTYNQREAFQPQTFSWGNLGAR